MPRPRRAEREQVLSETRQRLLQAAAAEFAREGFVGANINRISLTAGFAKGTVYNHFPSKRDLMLALIDHIATAHVDFILERVEPEEDPVRGLERFFSAGFAFVEQHPDEAPVVINAIYGPDAEFKARVFLAYDRLFALLIQDVLEHGIARGDFRSVDSDLTAALLMSIYLGGCSLRDAEWRIQFPADQVIALILEGLRRRDPPQGDEE
jgi:AcrR family transcriptional regulator